MRNYMFTLLLVLFSLRVQAEKKPKMQTVYIFGFSASFTDSTAYLTDVMQLDSAYVTQKGFLADRSLYSLQLENYIQEKHSLLNTTNAVFFSVKKKSLDKKYDRVKRMYQSGENLRLNLLHAEDFRFLPQEYIETVIEYGDGDEAVAVEAAPQEAPEKKSKGKKKK